MHSRKPRSIASYTTKGTSSDDIQWAADPALCLDVDKKLTICEEKNDRAIGQRRSGGEQPNVT